ncbi:hypothetical protein CTZ24_04330 [Pantoea phytobeneficialis]|uniref:Uncharacterized protein n=1 Tax=Pantoea phytobeneficialis TaxID=2052056 RepID=A0AAP9H2Y2_9GAMM|nr:hypothetical protein CTZ24_04330 [Pantoea phytobeneficialis]
MTLTNKTKFFLRWSGIGIVSIFYFLGLMISSFSYSDIYDKQSMQLTKTIPVTEHWAITESLIESLNVIINTAFLGFIICVPLILIIFKKVR